MQFYILRRLAASLFLVALVVSTVLFLGQTVQFLDRVPDVGLDFVIAVLPLFLPVTLALTLPFSFLVAIVLTYGRLADDNEITAMRMAGLHPWVAAAPGVFAGAALSFFCLDLQGNLAPAAIAGQDSLKGDIYVRFLEILERGEKNSFTNRDFKISWSGMENGELRDLHITRGSSASAEWQEIHAARGVLRRDPGGGVLVFSLRDFVMVAAEAGRETTVRGASWTYAIPAAELLAIQGGTAKGRGLVHGELVFRIFRLPPGSERWRELMTEVFGRIAIALSPLGFALCGIPLALLVGKGSRAAAAVLSFGVAVIFVILWQGMNSLSVAGKVPPALGLLSADAFLAVSGAVLFAVLSRR
jgi:hypothetical protein